MHHKRVTQSLTLICGIALLLACVLTGCQQARTIYVPDGTPVRLRSTIKDAEVWVQNEKGDWVPGRLDLPEGWYALPDPGAGEKK